MSNNFEFAKHASKLYFEGMDAAEAIREAKKRMNNANIKKDNYILFGPMGAGKTTIANILEEYEYRRASLGAVLTKHVKMCNYEKLAERPLKQAVGQYYREIFGIDVWNYVLYNQISNETENYDVLDSREMNYVIDDGRQNNEYEFWKSRGFITIGVIADEATRDRRLMERDGYVQRQYFNHPNELQSIQNAMRSDIIVQNDCSLESLRMLVDKLIIKNLFERETA